MTGANEKEKKEEPVGAPHTHHQPPERVYLQSRVDTIITKVIKNSAAFAPTLEMKTEGGAR
jgi:hypothetical protein